MAYMTRSPKPTRPSIEMLGSSVSTGLGGGLGLEDEVTKMEDEGETVDSVMSKLAIERRVQYGAEKMLDVIEKRAGGGDGDQEQVKDRITAQLEAANEHIKVLEARLERLKGDVAGTPSRTRRRPQPRLNGYASTSSLGLGQSLTSSTGFSSSSHARLPRQGSNYTPDREREGFFSPGGFATPSKRTSLSGSPSRPRSHSVGEDVFDMGMSSGASRMGWIPRSASRASLSGSAAMTRDEGTATMLGSVTDLLSRLRESIRRGDGKGKEREERGDKVYEALYELGGLFKRSENLKLIVNVDDVIQCTLPWSGDDSTVGRRTAAYRLLRLVLDRSVWGRMVDAGVEWLIIRSFTRDAKALQEREQALRLLRSVIALPRPPPHPFVRSPSKKHGHSRNSSSQSHLDDLSTNLVDRRVPLTDGMVRALVSVAENPEDPLRNICMETLIEIGVLDLECLVRSDAFRTVLLAFKDGPVELGPAITGSLLSVANQPSTRRFLLQSSDVESVLVGLTEEYGKISSRQHVKQVEKLQATISNITLLLSSWAGLLYLCMDGCRAFKTIVGSLYAPMPEVREAVLDLVFVSLRIKNTSWMNAFLDGKRLTVYNRLQLATSQLQDESAEDEIPQTLNLVDHFVALLLAILIETGLFEALVTIIEETNGQLSRKATLLLGEVLQMGNRILPLQYAAQLQSLPRLFTGATDFANSNERHFALSALSSIDSLNRNQAKALKQDMRDRSKTMQDSLQHGQRQIQQVKLRMGLQLDDRQFQQMISDSAVLLARDHTKWNYDVIVELIEGPLLNPKRLDEAIKATKFIRRLFSFFHPFNNRFSSIKRTRPNHKWVKLGCSMISTMLVNPEGIRFLTEDKLLKQMVDCFDELDQYVGTPSAQPVLARDRLENSLTYGYFEMIGTLSKHREGIKLLEKFKFFTCFYHLSEQRSRDDIIRIIIECFDYTIDAHPRIVLAKALTSSYMETRLFATHHLGRLLQQERSLTDWALQLMITQLYDTTMDVCDVALMYLEEACTDPVYLEKVVQLRPTLEHLGEIGHPLFMRFISTSAGFQYLHQAQYIQRELETWLKERNLLYVIEVETFVSRTLRPFGSDTIEDYWSYDGFAPTHFFGELTKTPEGCQLLREKGLVTDFAEIVRLHGMEIDDQTIMTNVKSVLWALGNIGSTEGGLQFLEDEEIIEVIIEIAEQSPVLNMKGTCFFIIGLISSTRMGAEILEEYGWIATRTSMGTTTGLCLPNDIAKFAHIEPWTREAVKSTHAPLAPPVGVEAEIVTSIANLSNYVLAAGAMNNLKRIRNRHPKYFLSMSLYHRVMRMISSNHYQAPVRRFILDLFNIELDPETLFHLRRLEMESRRSTTRRGGGGDRRISGSGQGKRSSVDGQGYGDRHGERRRSASSPGPEPPGRLTRTRGLTISEMGSNVDAAEMVVTKSK